MPLLPPSPGRTTGGHHQHGPGQGSAILSDHMQVGSWATRIRSMRGNSDSKKPPVAFLGLTTDNSPKPANHKFCVTAKYASTAAFFIKTLSSSPPSAFLHSHIFISNCCRPKLCLPAGTWLLFLPSTKTNTSQITPLTTALGAILDARRSPSLATLWTPPHGPSGHALFFPPTHVHIIPLRWR